MQKLLISRRQKEEVQQKISKLSPQKYGKGAFCDLSYTPSKLADHILYREANYLKKVQEQSSKCRELESQNKNLLDQVEYLKRERDGIENSLNKMIIMYKGIISDMEAKNEERIRHLQVKFREEQIKFIKEKDQEAKYVQSEKEVLEQRILQIEEIVESQKVELARLNRTKNQIQKELDQLIIEHKHLNEKFADLTKRSQEDSQRAADDYSRLKQEFMHAEVQWKNQLRDQVHKKDLEIQKTERAHKAEMQKLENQRNTENLLKNQEINQLTKTFESQSLRMRQILQVKDKMIDSLTIQNNRQKARVLSLTRDYETEINHLTHQKNRLLEEVDFYAKDNEGLAKEKAFITDDLQRENIKLRDLLYESSVELQKCKSELVGLAKDNTRLLNRVKSSEQQAKTWRDSYYLNKNRPT